MLASSYSILLFCMVGLCLIVMIMKDKEEMVGKQFNSFEELEPLG